MLRPQHNHSEYLLEINDLLPGILYSINDEHEMSVG